MEAKNLVARLVKLAKTSKNSQPSIHTPARPSLPACPECGGLGFFKSDKPPGHAKFGQVERCENEIHGDEQLHRLSEISKIPVHFLGRNLWDISRSPENREMILAAFEMRAFPFGFLYLWGGPGNAKSEVLISLCNHFNQTGRTAVYIKFKKILDWIKESFSERKKRERDPFANDGYIDRFNRLASAPVLAIDEMDKARMTEFAEEFRFDFLDDRSIQALAGQTITLFAGNDDPAKFPSPVWDRLRDGRFRVIENRAGSARPNMRRE